MNFKALMITLCSLVLVGVIAFLIYWGVHNYQKVEAGINGTSIYTIVDLENAKMEGYQEGSNGLQDLEDSFNEVKERMEYYKEQYEIELQRNAELTEELNSLGGGNE